MSYILEAKGLNTFYGRSHILFDVDLSVAPVNGGVREPSPRERILPPFAGHSHRGR